MKKLLQRNKRTGQFRVKGFYGTTSLFTTDKQAIQAYKKLERNSAARERNQILRDLTGTNARAARLDIGNERI